MTFPAFYSNPTPEDDEILIETAQYAFMPLIILRVRALDRALESDWQRYQRRPVEAHVSPELFERLKSLASNQPHVSELIRSGLPLVTAYLDTYYIDSEGVGCVVEIKVSPGLRGEQVIVVGLSHA